MILLLLNSHGTVGSGPPPTTSAGGHWHYPRRGLGSDVFPDDDDALILLTLSLT